MDTPLQDDQNPFPPLTLTDNAEENVQLLLQGFEAFNQATLKLQVYYRGLEEKVDELNNELAEKNKELEHNLMERERVKNFLSNIFESSAIGILVTDLDGIVTSVNQTGLRLLEEDLKDVQGKYLNDIFQADILPWDLTFSKLKLYEHVNHKELDYIQQSGIRLRLLHSISLMYSEHGDVLGLIVNVQDITELKRLEAQAERKNRFTVMGEMAATMAHEIRNPLGSIELFSSLLRKEIPVDSSLNALIDHVATATKSMNHIITNLLEYTNPRQIRSMDKIELGSFLKEVLLFSQHHLEHNLIQVKLEFSENAKFIVGDRELLKQVFQNLVINAIQAMLEPGTLSLKTREVITNNPKILERFRSFLNNSDNLHLIEVRIQDTGIGMSDEVRKKIFDPFFTTKERGTGLGLAIVHNIIEAHGALIDVESEPDKGTTFTLLFPIPTTRK